MTETTQFIIKHGLPLVFGAVLVEQLGLPLPSLPWLLAAGALSAAGKFNLPAGIAVVMAACLIADLLWFYLGRYRGNQVLGFLCRISLEPDSCVRRTQNVFTKYGLRGLAVAKFVPGMNTVAPPLAGMAGVKASHFLLVDGFGSLLYGSTLLGIGYAFSGQIEQVGAAITQIGGSALGLLTALLVLYIGYKYWQRRRLLHELQMARITVSELRQKLDAGENPIILDVRSRAELNQDPSVIHGAVHVILEEIEQHRHELPHDRDIIIYCSCPNEVTSARIALMLQHRGFTRVRPLVGGINAWKGQNYPLDVWTSTVSGNVGTRSDGEQIEKTSVSVVTITQTQKASHSDGNPYESQPSSKP
jgi:membrane protein DedA with SNARE-associated domain/rhodanese-related sulfurtransferase